MGSFIETLNVSIYHTYSYFFGGNNLGGTGASLDETFPVSPSSSTGSVSSTSTIRNINNSGFGIQTPPVSRVGTPVPDEFKVPPMPSNWD